MEDRVQELEAEINRLEDTIAGCEAALQTFFSAEETQRLTQQLQAERTKLQTRLAEWEKLGEALEASSPAYNLETNNSNRLFPVRARRVYATAQKTKQLKIAGILP